MDPIASPPKLHANEVEIDLDLARRLIRAQFPEWADLPMQRVPSTGTVNAIFKLGPDMSVRLPRVKWGASELAELESYHQLLLRLAPQLPVAIPAPVAIGTPGEGYPFPWAIHRWLPGENPVVEEVAGSELLAGDLIGLVTALRAIDTTGAPPSGRDEPLAARDRPMRKAMNALAADLDIDQVSAAWAAALQAPEWDGPLAWIHGDLLPGNLLVDQRCRLLCVIDFEAIGVGDPAIDLMPAWSMLNAHTRPAFRAALEADDATWARGRGWALSVAMFIIPYYRTTNPGFVTMASHMVEEVLAEYTAGL